MGETPRYALLPSRTLNDNKTREIALFVLLFCWDACVLHVVHADVLTRTGLFLLQAEENEEEEVLDKDEIENGKLTQDIRDEYKKSTFLVSCLLLVCCNCNCRNIQKPIYLPMHAYVRTHIHTWPVIKQESKSVMMVVTMMQVSATPRAPSSTPSSATSGWTTGGGCCSRCPSPGSRCAARSSSRCASEVRCCFYSHTHTHSHAHGCC